MHVERHAFTTFAARTPGGSLIFIQLKLGVEAVTPSWAKESRPRPRNTKDFIVGFVGFAITWITRILKTKHLPSVAVKAAAQSELVPFTGFGLG